MPEVWLAAGGKAAGLALVALVASVALVALVALVAGIFSVKKKSWGQCGCR